MRRSHGNQDRRSISLKLVSCPGSSGVELRGHKDGTTFGVDEQMATSIVIQEKAVAAGPVNYSLSAASQHCDIERFDL